MSTFLHVLFRSKFDFEKFSILVVSIFWGSFAGFPYFATNISSRILDLWDLAIVTNREKINGDLISNSKSEKLLIATIDYKLTFDEHVSWICDKASKKLKSLARVFSFMKPEPMQIMRTFISSQFGYCHLVWFFCIRRLINHIIRIQVIILH